MRRLGLFGPNYDVYTRLAPQLDASLDKVIRRLSPDVTAELMAYVASPEYLVTVSIRPDAAPLLPTRLRSGEGIAGEVLKTGRPVVGPSDVNAQPRLLDARSAVAVPIFQGRSARGRLIGVLNLESHEEHALSLDSTQKLNDSVAEIASLLSKLPLSAMLSGRSMIDFLLNKIEKEVVFILDPERLNEIYHQIRQASERLTSASDVAASILLRKAQASVLGFGYADVEDGSEEGDWIVPTPNVGKRLDLPEKWDLLREPSITREVLASGSLRYLNDVSLPEVRMRRKPVPPPYDKGSELNVPFGESEDRFGTIILLSPKTDAFDEEDQLVVASLARYLGVITRRIEHFLETNHPQNAEQNRVRLKIRDIIDPLYNAEDFGQLSAIRDQALGYIAREAKLGTQADVGGVVLAEMASDRTEELVWNSSHLDARVQEAQEALKMNPFRLATSQGLVGKAFNSGKPLRIPDVHATEWTDIYVPAFPDVTSELAVPLLGRHKTWGVIDVESTQSNHFTPEHQKWVGFLATEAVEVLETLDMAVQRWFESRLSALDRPIADMRESDDLEAIQTQRLDMLQQLLNDTRALTGATTAQIYVVANGYNDDNSVNQLEGALGAVSASPARDFNEETSGMRHHIKITEGMAGRVVETGQVDFFKDPHDKPERHLYNGIDARSALVVPILETQRVIAILNLESTEPRWCGMLQIEIAGYAARLASRIQVEYTLSMEMRQAEALHEFEAHEMHRDTPDVKAYMRAVLSFIDDLTISPEKRRWAQMALIQGDQVDYAISHNYSEQEPSEEKDVPLVSPLLKRVCDSQRPCLIPNLRETARAEDKEHLPWEEAQSLVCVPLVLTSDHDNPAILGYLAVASSQPYHLNDGDRKALHRFSETVVHGLRDIARMYSRVTLVSELKSEFRAFSEPGSVRLSDLREEIRSIPDARDGVEAATQVISAFRPFEERLQLVRYLPQWYLILSNFYRMPPLGQTDVPQHALVIGDIVQELRVPMDTFVRDKIGSAVDWRWEDTVQPALPLQRVRLTVGADDGDDQVIMAAIFGCIAQATTSTRKGGGDGHDIRVVITRDSRTTLRLSFRYFGRPITEKYFSLTPHYWWDEEAKLNTVEIPERRLAETRHIARSLKGDVTIREIEAGRRYAIEMVLPCLP